MDFTIPQEIEDFRILCQSFAKDKLFKEMREGEKNRSLSQQLATGLGELGLSDAVFQKTDTVSLLALSLAVEELAKGDVGGLLRNGLPGPYAGAISLATRHNLGDTPDLEEILLLCQSNRLSVHLATCESLYPDIPSNARLAWSPGNIEDFHNYERQNEKGTHVMVFIVGRDFVSLIPTDSVVATSSLPGAFEASGGISLDWSADPERISTLHSSKEALFVKSVARLWVSSALVGLGQASVDYAIEYGKSRVVFDLPVVSHQANAFDLAEASTRLQGARLMTRMAASLSQDEDVKSSTWFMMAAQAYLESVEAAQFATGLGLLLLGGHGYMRDHPVEKWFREASALPLLFGGQDSALADLDVLACDYIDPLVI